MRPLVSGPPQVDAWYKQALKDNKLHDDLDAQAEQEPCADQEIVALPALLPPELVVPQVAAQGFVRCTVSEGHGSEELKVYFDNFTGGGCSQRGWVDCRHHDCRHYRPVSHGQSREDYCARQYVWHRCGEYVTGRKAHLDLDPDEVAVEAMLPVMILVDF